MKNNKISEIGNDVAFGENGSRILVLSTIFEFRNPDGTDLAIVRAKSPVDDNDVATRKFVLDEIANVSSPDLSGYATTVYVNNQDGITLSNANAYTDNEILAINTVLTSHDNRITALENNPSGYTSPITTKGDIFVGNAIGDDARLPVGLNGQVLEADSTQTNGVAWKNKPDLSVYETIANVDSKDAAVLAAANAYTDANIGGGGNFGIIFSGFPYGGANGISLSYPKSTFVSVLKASSIFTYFSISKGLSLYNHAAETITLPEGFYKFSYSARLDLASGSNSDFNKASFVIASYKISGAGIFRPTRGGYAQCLLSEDEMVLQAFTAWDSSTIKMDYYFIITGGSIEADFRLGVRWTGTKVSDMLVKNPSITIEKLGEWNPLDAGASS